MRALAVLGLAACYHPRPCEIVCTDTCPDGMMCMAGLCTEGQMCTSPTDYATVAVGARHACALTLDGKLYCWGDDSSGQLGADAMTFATVPTRVGDDNAVWTAVSAGFAHTCGIRNGVAVCWGANESSQVTGGQPTASEPLAEVMLDVPVDQISAGKTHTCAVGGGQLWCWGDAAVDGVGARMGQIPGTWNRVAVAGDHSCAITGDSVMCWGDNEFGELGTDNNMNFPMPTMAVHNLPATPIQIAVGDYVSCAIVGAPGDTQGQLWCWGNDDVKQVSPTAGDNEIHAVEVGTQSDWTAIEIGVATKAVFTPITIPGRQRVCGIRGGNVVCWGAALAGGGDGRWNALATGPDAPVSVAHADALALGHAGPGDEVACLLKSGAIACWGDNRYGELGIGAAAMEATPVEVTTEAWDVVRSGHHHTCALSSGALSCWGADDAGQIHPGHKLGGATACTVDDCDALMPVAEASPIDRPTDVIAGDDFSCALVGSDVHCWGSDASGQLGVGTVVAPITTVPGAWSSLTGGDRIVCGACGSGCYQCWGVIAGTVARAPTTPPLDPYNELHAGENFACGLKSGTRFCWGENARGQLGDGTTIGPKPTPENLESGLVHVAAAGLHGCAVRSDGHVTCWGSNTFGESGTAPSAAVPSVQDLGLTVCSAIAVAPDYACAICASRPVCWGRNDSGQLGRGTTSDSEAPAVVDVPDVLLFTDVVVGETRACARESTGRLFCWGYGPRGELGTGGHATNLPTPLGMRR